eukprot:4477003-Pleurochrysis_carterae.AAC.1
MLQLQQRGSWTQASQPCAALPGLAELELHPVRNSRCLNPPRAPPLCPNSYFSAAYCARHSR